MNFGEVLPAPRSDIRKNIRTKRTKFSMRRLSFLIFGPGLGVALALAACATDGAGISPLSGAARAIGVTTDEPVPAEFVRAARPQAPPDFIPVGVTPPARTEPKRDPAQLEKLEAELKAQRDRSRSYAGRPKPPSAYDGRLPPRPSTKAPATE